MRIITIHIRGNERKMYKLSEKEFTKYLEVLTLQGKDGNLRQIADYTYVIDALA